MKLIPCIFYDHDNYVLEGTTFRCMRSFVLLESFTSFSSKIEPHNCLWRGSLCGLKVAACNSSRRGYCDNEAIDSSFPASHYNEAASGDAKAILHFT